MIFKKVCSVLLSISLSLVVASSALAQPISTLSTEDLIKHDIITNQIQAEHALFAEDYNVLSQTEQTEIDENGTIKYTIRTQIEGNIEDLNRIVSHMETENEPIFSIQNIEWNSGKWEGATCKRTNGAQLCTNGGIFGKADWGGLAGWSTNGQIVSTILPLGSSDASNFKVRPRVKIEAYGIVGGSSILYETIHFYHNNGVFDSPPQIYSFNESGAGFVAYLNFNIGSDFQWSTIIGNYSDTVWIPLNPA